MSPGTCTVHCRFPLWILFAQRWLCFYVINYDIFIIVTDIMIVMLSLIKIQTKERKTLVTKLLLSNLSVSSDKWKSHWTWFLRTQYQWLCHSMHVPRRVKSSSPVILIPDSSGIQNTNATQWIWGIKRHQLSRFCSTFKSHQKGYITTVRI